MAAVRVVAALILASLAVASAQTSPLVTQLNSAGFSGFVTLLEHADMVPELETRLQTGTSTLFIPTNEALMYRVSPALIAYLKAPANKDLLRQVLRFHILTNRVSAFKWDGRHETVEGSTADLRMDALAFYVANVPVRQYNAVVMQDAAVHSVSGLLIPRSLESTLGNIGEPSASDDGLDMRRILQGPGSVAAPSSAPPSPTTPPPPGKSSTHLIAGSISLLVAVASVALLS